MAFFGLMGDEQQQPVDPSLGILPPGSAPQQQGGILGMMRDPRVRAALVGASRGFADVAASGRQGAGLALSQGLAGAAEGAQSWEEQQAKAAAERVNNSLDYRKKLAEVNKLEKESQGGGAFAGQGLEAQFWNVLLDPSLDPSSPAAQVAYANVTQPRTYFDPTLGQMITVSPQIPKFISEKFGQPTPEQDGAPVSTPQVSSTKVAPGSLEVQQGERQDQRERQQTERTQDIAFKLNADYEKEYTPIRAGLENINQTRGYLQEGTGVALAGALQRTQKLFDEGVVREEDIQRLSGTAGAAGLVRGAIARAQSGAPIPPAVVRQIAGVLDATERMLNQQSARIDSRYIEKAEVNEVPADRVLGRKIKTQPRRAGGGKITFPGE